MKKKSNIASESDKVRRTRERLQRRIQKYDQQVNKQALEQQRISIHRWVAKNAPFRVALRTKTIALFDENQNTAICSAKIQMVAQSLKDQLGFFAK